MVIELKPAAPLSRLLACGRPSGRQFLWAVVFGISLGVGSALLKHLPLPAAVRYLIPFFPLVFGLLYARALVGDIRRQMDELQLRIYLEATAVVVCGLFIVMLVYPLLEAAHLVGPLDSFGVFLLIVVLGLIGYFTAARRYR